MKVVQSNLVYKFISGFVVSLTVKYEMVDCFWVRDNLFVVVTCIASVRVSLVDSVEVSVKQKVTTAYLQYGARLFSCQ